MYKEKQVATDIIEFLEYELGYLICNQSSVGGLVMFAYYDILASRGRLLDVCLLAGLSLLLGIDVVKNFCICRTWISIRARAPP